MDKEEDDLLLPETTSFSTPTTSSIISRLIFVLLITIISIWATYEASNGFEVTILNEVKNTSQGHRFHILFASDDRATRVLLAASCFAQRILYRDDRHPKKPVCWVTLRLVADISSASVAPVGHGRFDIHLSSAVMDSVDVAGAVASALQRAMARVWVWDGPAAVVDALVECIAVMAGLAERPGPCGAPRVGLAQFLLYCERAHSGFLARLNGAMGGPRHVRALDDVLGQCASYHASTIRVLNSTDSTSASA